MAELFEFIKTILEETLPWLAPFIAPAIFYFRWMEKTKKIERERRIESKLDYLIELEGGRWNVDISHHTNIPLVRRGVGGSIFSWAGRLTARSARKSMTLNMRRTRKMNQNINWVTLIVSLLGAIKLVLQMFGIQIPDQNINEIANGAAALVNIVGIIMSHRKEGATNGLSQFTNTIGNNK
jgi:uncharacterized membrane protein